MVGGVRDGAGAVEVVLDGLGGVIFHHGHVFVRRGVKDQVRLLSSDDGLGARGRGVGQGLLDALEERARERGCCKISLEVHDTNTRAKALYRRRGFGPWEVPTWFVTKPL